MQELSSGIYAHWKYSHKRIETKVNGLVKHLPTITRTHRTQYIAVTGTSGIVLISALSLALPYLNFIIVRKPYEQSHGYMVEGVGSTDTCIFLDDFVGSGATVSRVEDALQTYNIKLVAIVCHEYVTARNNIVKGKHGRLPKYHFD